MDKFNKILFLDTSVFEKYNFLMGHNLKKLGELGNKGEVNIKITNITYREILSRIRKNLTSTKSHFDKALKLLNAEGKILKNIEEYNNLYSVPKINIESNYKLLKNKVDEFINNSKIEILPIENASINEVFEQYFNLEKPFGEGQKKSEFPDAFTLNVIEKWVIQNNVQVNVLSTDNDLLQYNSNLNGINMINDLSVYLAAISERLEQNKLKLEFIKSESLKVEDEIDRELNNHLYDTVTYNLVDQIRNDPWIEEMEYEFIDFKNTKIVSSIITDLNDEFVFIELIVDTDISIAFEYNDLTSGIYDREDGIWYNVEYRNEEKVYVARIKLMGEFTYEYSNESKIIELNKIEFLDIEEYKESGKSKINIIKQ